MGGGAGGGLGDGLMMVQVVVWVGLNLGVRICSSVFICVG